MTPDSDIRRCWNYEFRWTPDHLTEEEMMPLRYTMDDLASDCIDPLTVISQSVDHEGHTEGTLRQDLLKMDMYALLRDKHHEHTALTHLWEQVNTVPDWVDWDQIERGQKVYYRYGQSMTAAVGISFHIISSSCSLIPHIIQQALLIFFVLARFPEPTGWNVCLSQLLWSSWIDTKA